MIEQYVDLAKVILKSEFEHSKGVMQHMNTVSLGPETSFDQAEMEAKNHVLSVLNEASGLKLIKADDSEDKYRIEGLYRGRSLVIDSWKSANPYQVDPNTEPVSTHYRGIMNGRPISPLLAQSIAIRFYDVLTMINQKANDLENEDKERQNPGTLKKLLG